MSERYHEIYRERATDYHRLVMAEDCDGNLLPALQAILAGVAEIDAVEIGIGTGRVTGLLVQCGVRSILGLEHEASMLAVAEGHVASVVAAHGSRCALRLQVGDLADGIPGADHSADLVIAGWVFGHMTQWFGDDWHARLDKILADAERVTRAGGVHIIIETLGTGVLAPGPPTPALAAYYRRLEDGYGFQRQELATDYQFPSVAVAAEICGGFFGPDMAATIRARNWARVPEWTGLWWRRVRPYR